MSELTIQASGFVIQPLVDQRDGPCEIRWWYNRPFLTSDNIQVQWGNGMQGFWVTTPCSIADGLINVDGDTILWTTDDAMDTSPLSIFLSAALYSARGKLIQQLQIANRSQWVVPVSLAPTTTWADFSIYNSANSLYYYNPNYLNAPQTVALINNAFDQHPASDTELGTVLLTIPADAPAQPVVWGANDPLVRDAVKLQGVDIDNTAPLDSQVLTYNQANNQWEPQNNASGSGNVISNEVSSVDGNVTLASGTGGKNIKFDASAHFDGNGLLTGATVDDPTGDLDIANKEFVLNSVAAAVNQTPNISALIQGGTVFWETSYNFRVSAATYLILGDLYSSAEQAITLDAADPSLDRIDVIALDVNGVVVKITGVAASQPSQPAVDPGTQLLLTFVFVGAATTSPAGVTNTDIYLDNAEWMATTSGSGWNVNSTNNPHSGTKCIEGTNVANGAYVQLQAPAPLTLDSFAILTTFVSPKTSWPKQRSLTWQWYSAGVAVGVPVTLNTGFFGFNSATISYQLVAIPIAQFAVPAGTSLNQLRITDKGGAIGMFIDDIVLQANGTSIGNPPTPGITQDQADARYLQRANNLSDVVTPNTALNTLLPTQSGHSGQFLQTNGTNTAWVASGAGSSVPTTIQGDTLYASAVNTLTALAKDTNATRYLSNTGASNNPAWAQVALATGISGFGTGVSTALTVNVGSAGAFITFNGALGTPSSGTLTSCTGLPVATGISGLGTGVATALAINVGSSGAFVTFNGALGTPSSGTLTSCTGLPISTGVSGLGSNVATFLATPSSANLAAALTDETGSGAAVFATSPSLTTPVLGTPTSGNLSNCTADGTNPVGFRNIPVNSQSTAYTAVLGDAGTALLHPSSDNNARTFTIPANASVAYPVGTALTFINMINTMTIAINSDTLTLMGAGTTGSRTLAANGVATAVKITSTSWIISGTNLT